MSLRGIDWLAVRGRAFCLQEGSIEGFVPGKCAIRVLSLAGRERTDSVLAVRYSRYCLDNQNI